MSSAPGQSGEFTLSQVPRDATYSGWHIALVVIGGTISIPGFLMAAQIGSSLGLRQAAIAFVLGCFVLGLLGAATGAAGQKSGLSAHMLGQFAFGRIGGRAASLAIALSLVGWFGVISSIFAIAAQGLAESVFGVSVPFSALVIVGGVLIVGVTIAGFKGLDRLALALVPLMFAFLLLAAWLSREQLSSGSLLPSTSDMNLATAVSAVIGSYIAGVAIQPDYARFAPSRKAALISAFFALGISFPLVLLCTAIPSVAAGESDLFKVMASLGIGVPAFALLGLAAWSSNVLCVYSAALSFTTIFPRSGFAPVVLAIGVAGTGLALVHVEAFLTDYLVLLSIAIPPIVGILASDALMFRSDHSEDARRRLPLFRIPPMLGWVAGIAAGASTFSGGPSPTGSPALDSIAVSMLVYLCGTFISSRVQLKPAS
ncbi:MAG: cytosine permease [Pseudomonadota bacterium]